MSMLVTFANKVKRYAALLISIQKKGSNASITRTLFHTRKGVEYSKGNLSNHDEKDDDDVK